MTDNEFLFIDRIQKIRSINEMYDLNKNAYISFSGGKDSLTVASIIQMALPNNEIPLVFFHTGLENRQIVEYIKNYEINGKKVTIVPPKINIRETLEKYGYPFKSKQHSHNLRIFQNSGMTLTNIKYLGNGDKKSFVCPDCLKYQFSKDFKIKVSEKCCDKMKKEVAHRWQKESGKKITITGMRMAEGGLRNCQPQCTIFDGTELTKFHPIKICSNEWVDWFIKEFRIELCELYHEPFNFDRTGCAGCPFAINLKNELQKYYKYDLITAKKVYKIWKPVYDEYARIDYRHTKSIIEKIKKECE